MQAEIQFLKIFKNNAHLQTRVEVGNQAQVQFMQAQQCNFSVEREQLQVQRKKSAKKLQRKTVKDTNTPDIFTIYSRPSPNIVSQSSKSDRDNKNC